MEHKTERKFNGVCWIVYEKHQYRIYQDKPTLNEATKTWETLSEWFSIIPECLMELFFDKEELNLLHEGKALSVVAIHRSNERGKIQPPEDPRDLENFRNGILYTLQD